MTTREELAQAVLASDDFHGDPTDADVATGIILAKLSEDDPERVGRAMRAAQKWLNAGRLDTAMQAALDAAGPSVVVVKDHRDVLALKREQDAMDQWKARAEKAERERDDARIQRDALAARWREQNAELERIRTTPTDADVLRSSLDEE